MTATLPGISVITVCRNAERTIEGTMQSIVSQHYPDLEYIVIDGASTDRTRSIVASYQSHIAHFISEPDDGIADAFNKGLRYATKEFVAFLNADDEYVPDALRQMGVFAVQHQERIDIIYGDAICTKRRKPLYRSVALPFPEVDVLTPFVCHQSVLVRRALFKTIGVFDKKYRFGMDFDWFLRARNAGAAFAGLPSVPIARYAIDGYSAQNGLASLLEFRRIAAANRVASRIRLEMYYAWKIPKYLLQALLIRAGLGSFTLWIKSALYRRYARTTQGDDVL
ncbi:PGL/p-HBAD biosynthesis glycosyltransferase [Anaerolineae bacterium]|nr:PGL/p-HBAD biosynthesis glycosyltransferase [Anaerolineae bacterium]